MNINIIFDSSVASAPAGFTASVNYAVNYLDSLFTNNVTINIAVGWGEVDGQALGSGALGESIVTNYGVYNYSTIANALRARGAPGSANLPATSPFAGSAAVAPAEAKALGLIPASSAIDGYIGLSSTLPFSCTPGVVPPSGEYYLIGVIAGTGGAAKSGFDRNRRQRAAPAEASRPRRLAPLCRPWRLIGPV